MSSETVRNAVATSAQGGTPKPGGQTVYQLIEKVKPQLARALPNNMSPDRLARIILTEVRKNPDLQLCTSDSLLGACLTAAQLGLEPGVLQHAYLIPRKNKGVREVTLMIGYRGIVDLAMRGGRTLSIDAHVVYENDEFSFQYGTEPHLHHVPELGDRGAVKAAYAVARLREGGAPFIVLSVDEINARRSHSESGAKGPWVSEWDAMARKSCVRALAPYLPQTPEFAQAQRVDETVRTDLEAGIEDYEPPADDAVEEDRCGACGALYVKVEGHECTIDAEGTEVDPVDPSAGSDPGADPTVQEPPVDPPESQGAGPDGPQTAGPAPATGALKKPPPSKRAKP